MPIATSPTPAHQHPSSSTTSILPPPQTFDILPPLHAILSRLLLPRDGAESSESSIPLSPKELAPAASTVTSKIQKARVAVKELQGVEMSIEEQEDVIAELEEEVRRLDEIRQGIQGKAREALKNLQSPEKGDAEGEAMEEN